jgi:hypothetical protein
VKARGYNLDIKNPHTVADDHGDPKARPSLDEFERHLWKSLERADYATFDGLQMQMDHIEGLSSADPEWPHMDERLMQLRHFYSTV